MRIPGPSTRVPVQAAMQAGNPGQREFCSWFLPPAIPRGDRKSTRLNSSHTVISYAVFCLKKKTRKDFHSILHKNRYTVHLRPIATRKVRRVVTTSHIPRVRAGGAHEAQN